MMVKVIEIFSVSYRIRFEQIYFIVNLNIKSISSYWNIG